MGPTIAEIELLDELLTQRHRRLTLDNAPCQCFEPTNLKCPAGSGILFAFSKDERQASERPHRVVQQDATVC